MTDIRITDDWLTSSAAQAVIGFLTEAGHHAFFVGGCVRNALLKEPVADVDIATSADPETVSILAEQRGFRAVPTGLDHGTVTIVVDHTPFEVTTFRRDVETDGRRAVVAFADTLDEDAQRRDFTMNALYADADGHVIDPVGGLPDLHARRLRFIGDPHDRIREDALRILRFFRFHAWYGDPDGGIDPDGLAACAAHVDMLDRLSRERVGHEMRKLLAAPDPAPALASFASTGGLLRILPGADATGLAVLVQVEREAGLAADWLRRLAMIGGEDATDRLRLSRVESRQLTTLMSSDGGPGELGYRLGQDAAESVMAIRSAQQGHSLPEADIRAATGGAKAQFPLKAADLADQASGPALGQALAVAERRWIDSGFTLTREDLLA